jgi:hypothetical protein
VVALPSEKKTTSCRSSCGHTSWAFVPLALLAAKFGAPFALAQSAPDAERLLVGQRERATLFPDRADVTQLDGLRGVLVVALVRKP